MLWMTSWMQGWRRDHTLGGKMEKGAVSFSYSYYAALDKANGSNMSLSQTLTIDPSSFIIISCT